MGERPPCPCVSESEVIHLDCPCVGDLRGDSHPHNRIAFNAPDPTGRSDWRPPRERPPSSPRRGSDTYRR